MIIGVAIRQNNTVYGLQKPNRHHDVIRFMVEAYNIVPPITGEQGFYDEEGLFLTRTEALKHAVEEGQINKHDHPYELFSEDLW